MDRALWWTMGSAALMFGAVLSVPLLRSLFDFGALHAGNVPLYTRAVVLSIAWFELLKGLSVHLQRQATFDSAQLRIPGEQKGGTPMPVSRRDFLRATSALAGAFGLRAMGAGSVSASEEGSSVVWLQAQGCTGCSISLLNSVTAGTAEDLLPSTVDLAYHSTLMGSAGPNAVAAATAAKNAGGYVLVVEGAVPTGADGKYCYLWPGTTARDGVREFAAKAEHVVAVGE